MFHPLVDSAILVFCYMLFWFVLAQILKNNSIVDIAWGLGFVAIVWWVQVYYPQDKRLILTTFVTIWGIRLATYIFIRNKGKGEDWRYANWRKGWGDQAFWKAFWRVFMLQGFIMWVIAQPLLSHGLENPGGLVTSLAYIGQVMAIVGIAWEGISDWQLYKYKADPKNKGKLMTNGLWALSRHPNYFGEMLFWWAVWLMALPLGGGLVALISPIAISYVLLTISGPMLEKRYEGRADFEEYSKHTPAFIPFWPVVEKTQLSQQKNSVGKP